VSPFCFRVEWGRGLGWGVDWGGSGIKGRKGLSGGRDSEELGTTNSRMIVNAARIPVRRCQGEEHSRGGRPTENTLYTEGGKGPGYRASYKSQVGLEKNHYFLKIDKKGEAMMRGVKRNSRTGWLEGHRGLGAEQGTPRGPGGCHQGPTIWDHQITPGGTGKRKGEEGAP